MGTTNSGGKLTPNGRIQKEILDMIVNEDLTIRQIASRRQTTIWAVYNIVKKLKKQGLLEGNAKTGYNIGAGCRSTPPKICLHAQRFVVKIINFGTAYARQQYLGLISNKGKLIQGNTIKLRKNTIEIYSLQRFYGTTEAECDQKAILYWKTYLLALESKYGAFLVKHNYYNINETYCHYALLENGIAYNQNIKRDRIYYYDEQTGKLWLQTDRSFNGNDLECEGVTARKDSQLLRKHLESMRNPNTPTNSEIWQVVKQQSEILVRQFGGSPEPQAEPKERDRKIPDYFG